MSGTGIKWQIQEEDWLSAVQLRASSSTREEGWQIEWRIEWEVGWEVEWEVEWELGCGD